MMVTKARSRLDISMTTFIGWTSEGGIFSVTCESLTISKTVTDNTIRHICGTGASSATDKSAIPSACLGMIFPHHSRKDYGNMRMSYESTLAIFEPLWLNWEMGLASRALVPCPDRPTLTFKEVDWERYGLCACIQPSPDLMLTSFPRNRRDCQPIPITESLISLFSQKLSPDGLSIVALDYRTFLRLASASSLPAHGKAVYSSPRESAD